MANQYGPGDRMAMMRPHDLPCRCGRKHCSPSCESCRIYGLTRCQNAVLR